MVVQLRSTPQGTLRHVSNHTQGRRQDMGRQNSLYFSSMNRNYGYGMEGWRSESLPTWVNQQARGPCVACASSSGQDDTASRIDRFNNSSMDPWDVLGVSPAASEKEIKKAHRRLVLEHHPDRHHVPQEENSSSKKTVVEKRFMKIQEAYEMLMGRRHGHVMGSKEGQNGWNFHDFFWSFNYHRRKKHMQGGGYGRSRPPPPAGAWKEQMSQLKQRAAVRKRREEEERKKKMASEDGLFSQISHAYSEGKRHHDEALHRMAGKSSSQIQSFQRIFSPTMSSSQSNLGEQQYATARARPFEKEEGEDDAYDDGATGTSSTGSGVSHQLAGLKRRAELKKRILHE
mmetsp:Transcript_6383/g.12583  ORF Transcript_6383/g.12583 Transcript_6383/m.12583 type:complete len:343 (+) Transcript_6383:67-1095(+)